jgi:hypothetical protein
MPFPRLKRILRSSLDKSLLLDSMFSRRPISPSVVRAGDLNRVGSNRRSCTFLSRCTGRIYQRWEVPHSCSKCTPVANGYKKSRDAPHPLFSSLSPVQLLCSRTKLVTLYSAPCSLMLLLFGFRHAGQCSAPSSPSSLLN